MAMQRPCWTICLLFVWILVIPGALLTHVSLIKSIPWIEDLPENIEKGLEDTFKFKWLKSDSEKVRKASEDALFLCDVNYTICPSKVYPTTYVPPTRQSNSSTQRTKIHDLLKHSLATVSRVAHDKYFGVSELQPVAEDLDKIIKEFNKTKDIMSCHVATPVYCEIFVASTEIIDGMAEVDAAMKKFTDGKIIQDWNDYSSYLNFMHAIPYILILGMLFMTCFWHRSGGVCCCCREGSILGFLTLPFIVLWLVSFILYFVILVIGVAVKFAGNKFEVSPLKDKPTLDEVMEHIQKKFPEFWSAVFADMEEGLDLLLFSSFFFTAASLIIAFYSCCLCMCCPYRQKAESAS